MHYCLNCKHYPVCRFVGDMSIAKNNVKSLVNNRVFDVNITCKHYEEKIKDDNNHHFPGDRLEG